MQLDQLRRSSLLGPGDLKLPERKLSNRMMPTTAEPLISDHVLNHPHVPFADSHDGSNDERTPRKTVHIDQAPPEVIVPSGGSSPHGLDANYSFSSGPTHENRDEHEHTATSSSSIPARVEINSNM